jgi:hypothetical protein
MALWTTFLYPNSHCCRRRYDLAQSTLAFEVLALSSQDGVGREKVTLARSSLFAISEESLVQNVDSSHGLCLLPRSTEMAVSKRPSSSSMGGRSPNRWRLGAPFSFETDRAGGCDGGAVGACHY